MSKYSSYLKIILVVLIPIIALLSLLLLFVNKGFYYSDFRNRIEVSLSSQNQEELNSATEALKSIPGLAYYNPNTNTFFYQNISIESIQNAVSGIDTESLDIKVKEVLVNNRYILENYIWFLGIVVLVTSGATFYIVLKEKGRINLKEALKFYSPFIVTIIFSSLVFLGILSLISRFRYISEFEFLTLFFINILTALIFFLSVYKIDYKEEFTLVGFSKRLFKTSRYYALPFLITFLVSMAAVLVVFGLETLPFIISFIIGLFTLYFVTMWVFFISVARINRPAFKLKKHKSTKKQEVSEDLTKVSPAKKKKKKSKKKKKK